MISGRSSGDFTSPYRQSLAHAVATPPLRLFPQPFLRGRLQFSKPATLKSQCENAISGVVAALSERRSH